MAHRAAFCLSLLIAGLLSACMSAPLAPPAPGRADEALFADALFAPPGERIDAADLFSVSEPMRRFLREEIHEQLRTKGFQRGLLDALYKPGQLRIEYDASTTRNAAQAFEARAGNCLSLVVMTAAFAKELGLTVTFQSAVGEETWSRSDNLALRSGHVNVTLGRRLFDVGTRLDLSALTVDFLPADEVRALRTRPISEATVAAMYMNNRAAEAMVAQRLDDAYAWAREAIRHAPAHYAAYNTLGVIYLRRGDAARADRVFAQVLAHEPANTRAMSNRVQSLALLGRAEDSRALKAELTRIEPEAPFHFFELGRAAMDRGDWRAARDLFAREVARAGYYHEFHYWLGVAHWRLGEADAARRELALAMRESTTRQDRDLYAAKLAWLRQRGME